MARVIYLNECRAAERKSPQQTSSPFLPGVGNHRVGRLREPACNRSTGSAGMSRSWNFLFRF